MSRINNRQRESHINIQALHLKASACPVDGAKRKAAYRAEAPLRHSRSNAMSQVFKLVEYFDDQLTEILRRGPAHCWLSGSGRMSPLKMAPNLAIASHSRNQGEPSKRTEGNYWA
jgi:hypothetical protein